LTSECASAGEGMITYMRTDGLQISLEAVQEIRSTVTARFGDQYIPATPRAYKYAASCAISHAIKFLSKGIFEWFMHTLHFTVSKKYWRYLKLIDIL